MSTQTMPSPEHYFQTINAFHQTAAIKAAVELDVFTAIGDGAATAAEIAKKCGASERGTRILCDFLTVIGFLTKSGNTYALTPESATFLTKRSPAYLGTMTRFLTLPDMYKNMDHLAETIRRGTVPADTVAEENPIWIEFARSMVPLMIPAAQGIADLVGSDGPLRVLDIAAGHGLFGITIAQRNPRAEVTAVDWPGVLEVAKENARSRGVQHRYRTMPGDAFKVEFGTGYDVALVTNFLHHFDKPTCVSLVRKVGAALKPGGRAVALEFTPNDDRVTPPVPAMFAMIMLAGTPGGDAYTVAELKDIFAQAGLKGTTTHALPSPETVLIATK
jgi:2-polyprenyl-3-methyl-5-hydroxy-6-metoxy-1,4-benzoquinol methylase